MSHTTLRRLGVTAALTVGLPLIAGLSVTTATAGAAPPASADAQVQQAIDAGPPAVAQLVAASANDHTLKTAILKRATVSTAVTRAASASRRAALGAAACHGTVTAKTTIGIVGVELGWRKAIVNSWCWNSSKITSQSLDHDAWSAFGYCWKEESQTNPWLIHPTRRKYRNKGTLSGVAPWGCAGGQQTISPSVHYERGGGWNVYAND